MARASVFDWPGWLAAAFTGATVAVLVVTYVLDRRRDRNEARRRYDLKVLIGELMDELTARLLYSATLDEYIDWTLSAQRLIDASLGRGEEQWVMEPIPGGVGIPDLPEERRLALLKKMHLRLQELMLRMDSIPLRPDFDPKKWRHESGRDG